MALQPVVASTKPAVAEPSQLTTPASKSADAKLKASNSADPAFQVEPSPKVEVKAPAVVMAGESLSSALADAESAIKAITPPKVETPTGEQIAQAASLRQVADWAQAQINLQKMDTPQRTQGVALNTRV